MLFQFLHTSTITFFGPTYTVLEVVFQHPCLVPFLSLEKTQIEAIRFFRVSTSSKNVGVQREVSKKPFISEEKT